MESNCDDDSMGQHQKVGAGSEDRKQCSKDATLGLNKKININK